jgi:hypothetical protein
MTVRVEDDRKADAIKALLTDMPKVTVSNGAPTMELASLWEVGPIEYYKEFTYLANRHPRLMQKQEDGTWKTLRILQ